MKEYYILLKGEPSGPLELREVLTMLRAGTITRDTDYCKEGWNEWRKVGELREAAAPINQPAMRPRKRMWFSPHPEERHMFQMIVFILILFGVVSMFRMHEREPLDEWLQKKARKQAEKFVLQTMVGARKAETTWTKLGHGANTVNVELTVDGLNKFGGPVRESVEVEMKFDGEKWRGDVLSKNLQVAR